MTKYLWIALTACLLIIAGLWEYGQRQRARADEAEQRAESIAKLAGDRFKELQYYKTKNGTLVAKVEQITLDNVGLKKMVDEGYYPALKELRSLKKDLRNIESLATTTTHVTDTLFFLENIENDTICDCSFSYKDKWTEIERVHDTVTYSFTVPQTTVVYWSRKWFLGKKKYWSESLSENPNAKIIESRSIQVKRR